MTVQIVEIAGQRLAVLPVADYERLVDIAEDRADANAAVLAEQRRQAGEEYLPAALVDRLLDGENALKVWRSHRGLTQSELGASAGVGKMAICRLETAKSAGSPKLWRAIAASLHVAVDDILPAR